MRKSSPISFAVRLSGVYKQLQTAGLEVLYDDRSARAGEKFSDADLLGIPARVTISNARSSSASWSSNGGVKLRPSSCLWKRCRRASSQRVSNLSSGQPVFNPFARAPTMVECAGRRLMTTILITDSCPS